MKSARFRWIVAALVVVLSFHCASRPNVAAVEGYEAGSFTASNGITIPYRILKPAGAGPFPLLVIFHGSGAIGSDNVSQLGPLAKSWATPERQRDFPATVLIPQFPARTAEYSGSGRDRRSVHTEMLIAGLELVRREAAAATETKAIGFSMGGSAVWNALLLAPGLFEAAVVVAGVPNPDAFAMLGGTRLLLVHGDADSENPYEAAWAAYERASGRVELRRFPGLAHEFPRELLERPSLAEWLYPRRQSQ